MAAAEGFSLIVSMLASSKRCDVNLCQTPEKISALHLLAYKGHVECFSDLIKAGIDVNTRDAQNRTALWHAISNSRLEVIKFFLQNNSYVDGICGQVRYSDEACEIKMAFSKGCIKALKLLLLAGYNVVRMRECLRSSNAEQLLGKECRQWINYANCITSLKSSCRKLIRYHLGRNLYSKLQILPVPSLIRDYLVLKELDNIINFDANSDIFIL